MPHTPEELDFSKRSRKSQSSRRNATAPGAWAARPRHAGVPKADIEIRITEGHEGEMLADLQAQWL